MSTWDARQGQSFRLGPRGITPGIQRLIVINAVVFLVTTLTGIGFWAHWFGLNPRLVFTRFHIWQPLTYLFLHAGLWHVGLNMLMLWMFGSELERLWGTREFLRYYFITGVGAGVFSLVPYLGTLLTGGGYVPSIIGASGAVYAVLLAYAMTYPERTVYIYFLMPVKVKYLMLFMGIVTFMSVGNSDGVAHITHLGGLVVGWIYLKRGGRYRNLTMNLPLERWWHSLRNLFRIRIVNERKKRPAHRESGWHTTGGADERSEMDQLLDKITQVGYENLSDAEKRRLLELSGKLSSQDRD